MPTIFTQGDLFAEQDLNAYAFGATSSGHMDAGIAVAFKKRWPRLETEYAARCADGRFHLGDVFAFVDGETTVYTLALQEHWKAKAKLAALSRAMTRVVELATNAGVLRIGLPRVGTGLGGLEWLRVKSVLTKVSEHSRVELVVFEKFVRAKPASADAPPATELP
ncbi:MAG TPA: macro domain-containing protein [Polyangiaceae bacterium]|nr:macro domain-containing protein [Polyangiaceae bacterium]